MGTLFIVATPIGNLKDITLRAVEALTNADYILCEDTRVTAKLLTHLNINNKMVSFNEFNEDQKSETVIADLQKGLSIALVSDAGTPLVSDPGFKLVREAVFRNIKVEAIPGPSSAITALIVSGLPTDKFTFIGYLSKKAGKKTEQLNKLKAARELIKSTVIIFESPYRVIKTLDDIKEVFGDINVVVCRELTKLHEEIYRGRISELKVKEKGEFVILF